MILILILHDSMMSYICVLLVDITLAEPHASPSVKWGNIGGNIAHRDKKKVVLYMYLCSTPCCFEDYRFVSWTLFSLLLIFLETQIMCLELSIWKKLTFCSSELELGADCCFYAQ